MLAALIAALVATTLPGAAHAIEPSTGCADGPGVVAGGGSGECPVKYVYVEPGDTVDFVVPSPFDGSVSVRVADAPSKGRLTQLSGRTWRYDATGVAPSYQDAWFRVCAGGDCAEVKVVVKVKDLSAPDTTIVDGPPATTLSTRAVFVVSASEGDVTFKCSLDGAAWEKCSSRFVVEGLAAKAHVMKVKAVDAQGNWDETPAVHRWVVGDGRFHDDESSVHESAIDEIAGSGITRGCNADGTKFCPDESMTRGQFAAFVNRALDLPATKRDFFDDDDGHLFEDDINRLAAAGYTDGCGRTGTRYCPDGLVTRGQIAAFIDRILRLPDGPDAFDDDESSIFEHNIDALAKAGITRGCDAKHTRYCPDRDVTRGEFATLFVRAGFTA